MTLDPSRIKGICFDIDGTLSDTDDQVVNKLVRWLGLLQFILKVDRRKLARKLVMIAETPGTALYTIPDRLHLDDELAWLMEKMSRWARKKSNFLLMPGVHELVRSLATIYPLVIISARDQYSADQFLRQHDLLPFFQHVISGQTCAHTKPFPDPILHSATLLGLQPGELVMVGDTIVDILSARRAGAQSVGVLCGFGEEAELLRSGANLILSTTSDLGQHFLMGKTGIQE